MDKLPHILLETANFHGGDSAEIERAIDSFSTLDYPDLGIKFHASRYDYVALPEFSWYETIKQFFIEEEKWIDIIAQANTRNFKVWLDLFCIFGVHILEQNLSKIHGLKLQPSILDNEEIFSALSKLPVENLELILNVSGLELSAIETYLRQFEVLHFRKIILQLGFQNFPTHIEDTSLKKIEILKAAFPAVSISYADHIDGHLPFARHFPIYAALSGCSYLEKHICNERKTTKFDANSALECAEVKKIVAELHSLRKCFETDFITENEEKYYEKSLQKPILRIPLTKGQLVSNSELLFRRTDKPGLNLRELKSLQNNFFILNKNLAKTATLTFNDFKKARIAAIVAARMKSSRLKKKAILPIHGVPSIERCLENCLKFPHVEQVILATSTVEEDAVLANYTLQGKVKFWRGDPDDVIARYLGACEKYGIDVIIRITGDCPVMSPEIVDFILKSHFLTGADFTEPRHYTIGTNSQVYNVEALKRVISLIGRAEYSEHMTYYMTNNPDIFKVNYVDLPPEWIRDYRLTLDYQSDLDMFNKLFQKLEEQNLDSYLVDILKVLADNPDIPKINADAPLIYKTDKNLIKLLKENTRINIKK
ncbi:cytidylyltransferase domain-containing protein [candidate division CSSED10-310 bacterium]|uniref:Cytidylyltransferase domain-containing protein n=1 Tax=candidate division CSSED10-310 bacterium TaxID=2855610 RepID=A0ABV6YYR7_UNCC1